VKEEHLHVHVKDEELLLYSDGEMRPGSSGDITAHLEFCTQCRARLKELENTLAEAGEAHRAVWAAELPTGAGWEALLKARLAELAAQKRENVWMPFARAVLAGSGRTAVLASVGIVLFFVVAIRWHGFETAGPIAASIGRGEKPDFRLTPGATVPVTQSEVCDAAAARTAPAVPVSLRRRVFEEYGVRPPQPDAYEVDFLITPELGGATDIRNLWPEPYQDTVWNAHVKDQLENRLHVMVCQGDVDLATAQRDISRDWIAAYRKYFHADRPVADSSSSNISTFRRSLPST
jgi:hypothetical protein